MKPSPSQFFRNIEGLLKRAFCLLLLSLSLQACGHGDYFRDTNMDFGSIRTVAIMPLANLAKDNMAGERVRDVLSTMLMATGGVYVLPTGEVTRAISTTGIVSPFNPTGEEIVKLAKSVKADAVMTGVIREYGDVRSGTASADVISFSMQLFEAQTGKVVWSADVTKGGIGISDRLFGGGGRPLNDITEEAVNEIIIKFYE